MRGKTGQEPNFQLKRKSSNSFHAEKRAVVSAQVRSHQFNQMGRSQGNVLKHTKELPLNSSFQVKQRHRTNSQLEFSNTSPQKVPTNPTKYPRATITSMPSRMMEMPNYVEKKAVLVKASGPSDNSQLSVVIPNSGSLIEFEEKKQQMIRGSESKSKDSKFKSFNEPASTSNEKFNGMSEMVESGALRSQAIGYNLEFKSKFAQKSPLTKQGRNGMMARKIPEAALQKANTHVSGDNSIDVIQSHHFSGPKSPSDHHFGMSKSFHVRGTGPRKTEKTVLSLTKLLNTDKSMRKRTDKLKQPQSIKDKQLSLD